MAREAECPHCGAALRNGKGHVLGRTAGAVLMGLSLAGCPASDDTSETQGGDGTSSTGMTSTNPTNPTNATSTTNPTEDTEAVVTAAAYGNPETDSFSTTDVTDSDTTSSGGDTDTDTDTDTATGSGSDSSSGSSTGISPDYGVPTTGE